LPGVGKKTAERLIIEMRDKLPVAGEANAEQISVADGATAQPRNHAKQEAMSALCALGYKPADASKMVQNIAQEDKTCEDIIRLALQGKIK